MNAKTNGEERLTLNCYFNDYEVDNYLTTSCHRYIVNAFEMAYPEITFNRVDTCHRVYCDNPNKKVHSNDKFGYHSLIIENDKTKKYLVITYMDKLHYMLDPNRNWDLENCVDIYASCGVHRQDFWYDLDDRFKAIPFTYSASTKQVLGSIKKYKGISTHMPSLPPFRGKLYNLRTKMAQDERFDVNGGHLEHDAYAREIASSAINLSINGVGETCQRDMEILATGTCLFREVLQAQFHDPLIPNHHYIAVDCEPIKHIRSEHAYFDAQKDVFIERWNEIKDNHQFISDVAANGKRWYDKNAHPKKHGEVAVECVDLYSLA